jgi:Tyrosine-protein kinase ephrin type A/B receptor-like/EGF-like domain
LETDCRQLCLPGTYARIKTPKKSSASVKTLMPFCRSCGIGEYQSKYDQTSCEKCPDNKTSDRGSKSIESCYEKNEKSCDDAICGDHGKCIPSGVFYHCECDDLFFGQNCELKQDQCSTSPCYNGATCKSSNVSSENEFICICPTGFNGIFCENVNDPCVQKNCQNGSQCIEFDGAATCDCLPGFQGELCDQKIAIDFCESSPCESGATCINQVDDYQCACDSGAIGKRCHLTACDYKPCAENAICVNLNVTRATKQSY